MYVYWLFGRLLVCSLLEGSSERETIADVRNSIREAQKALKKVKRKDYYKVGCVWIKKYLLECCNKGSSRHSVT